MRGHSHIAANPQPECWQFRLPGNVGAQHEPQSRVPDEMFKTQCSGRRAAMLPHRFVDLVEVDRRH